MADLEILWVDDDSPSKIQAYEGVHILTAQSCGQAEKLLNSRSEPPHWAVIDLIIPQEGWGNTYYETPGINYISHLKRKYGDKIKILALSIIITDEIRQEVIAAGANDALAKPSVSWAEIVKNLQTVNSRT